MARVKHRRTQREDRRGLDIFPLGARGRGKEAHLQPHHLVNLVIGMAAADPITEAADFALTYRRLVATELRITETEAGSVRTSRETTEVPSKGHLEPLLHHYGPTFGKRMDGLISLLAMPHNKTIRDFLRSAGMSAKLVLGPVPEARFVLPFRFGDDPNDRVEEEIHLPPQEILALPRPIAEMRREVWIPFSLFEILTNLWADTLPPMRKPCR